MPGWVGRTIGKVSIELLLSRGQVADVYLARQAGLQRAVAIQLLNVRASDDARLQEKLQRHLRLISTLRHPGIVQLHEYGIVDDRPYLVMDYVPGTSLAAHLATLPTVPAGSAAETIGIITATLAGALQHAHDRGVIHGDLNPSNILLSSPSIPIRPEKVLPGDVRALITDFGMTQFVPGAASATSPKQAPESPYLSPEQGSGSAADARSDIYALGMILRELIVGYLPGSEHMAAQTPPHEVDDTAADEARQPIALLSALDRATRSEPSERFQSVREFGEAIREALAEPMETAASSHEDESRVESGATESSGRLRRWLSTAGVGVAILALVAILGLRFLQPAPSALAPSEQESVDSTAPASGAAAASLAGDPIGVGRFQAGASRVDKVTFSASLMPPPPAGNQYEIWLVSDSGEERRSVGYLALDVDGNGSTTFVDEHGRNLLATYSGLEITVEPSPDPNPNPASNAIYSTRLPDEGLIHVRHLLVSFQRAPSAIALLDGLVADAELGGSVAREMLALYESGNETGTRSQAEALLNMLVGNQSPDYRDWDLDGQVEDAGDGYGMLLNGDQSGYIQGSFAHAEFSVSSADATEQMQSHGEHVMVATRNLEGWTPELRDLVKRILASSFDPAMGALIRQAVALSDTILLGTDLNGNERVEAIAGEGGAQTAYQHALYMADMAVTVSE